MILPSRSLWGRWAIVALTGAGTSACVSDFVGPAAVVSHRYALSARASKPPVRSVPEAVQADDAGPSDRVPAPREIFDFHPRGYASDEPRQPFVVNLKEGPLKIHHWTAAELAETGPAPRQGETAAAVRLVRSPASGQDPASPTPQ